MRRVTTGVARGAPRRGTPRTARLGAVLAVAMLSGLGTGQAMAAPGAAPKKPTSAVSTLINQIASTNQNIKDLDGAVAVRQENANRSLADYQNSVAAQQLATQAAAGAENSLSKATRAAKDAQKSFDALIRDVYRNGSTTSSMTKYVSSDNPDRVLDRMSALDRLARSQQDTIRRLQVARNQQANRVSALQALKRQAALATSGAEQRKNDALAAVREAQSAITQERQRRNSLVAQRDSIQQKLDRLRGTVTTPKKVDAPAPADLLSGLFPGLPGIPGPRPSAPGATQVDATSDNQALQVAAEAAARLAGDLGQKALAALVGQAQIPHSELLDELGLGGASLGSSGADSIAGRLGSGSLGTLFGSSSGGGGGGPVRPGLRGPQAVEIVVNRALSQLNVPYAWGGGDANGPTQGIRDGGVADRYGDYNKIGYDCSGLMMYAFAGVGIQLPHYTGYQYTSGPQVPLAQMQRGDMIFYGPNASEHVALYLGDNKMVEAPQSGDVVKVSPLRTAGAMPNVVRLL
ncbi:NlpC/P60 family protein [Gordonia aichiensis]|uniref:NlpC/P60 family protein n=1 Tax=Gordonia aichiensis TaxID=36820 RepID=UPI00058AEA3D|nr:NlpC/P60 family protein [Gordonia aichiensis]